MTRTPFTALCAAIDVAADAAGDIPEWIHLLPAGEIRTVDGRGPYTVPAMATIVDQLKRAGKSAIDECHSSDLAARDGRPAPARGWIVDAEAREDGLWGKVEWTGVGRQLMADKAYRGISPVIAHDKSNKVLGVLRASLINTPNLHGLTALHGQSEEADMDWKAKLIAALGLDDQADDASIEAALASGLATASTHSAQEVITSAPYVALQGELTSMTDQFNTLSEQTRRDKATAFVDGNIAAGCIGLKPARDEYIAIHMESPERAQTLVSAMSRVKTGATVDEPAPKADPTGLDDGEKRVIQLMGISEEEYLAARTTKKAAL